MDRFTNFKLRLAVIGFLPSLIFACLTICFIYLNTDLPPVEIKFLLSCASFILVILIPLSIWFDRRWQKPLMDKIHAYHMGQHLSDEEIHRIHEIGLRFPMYTYIFNLVWWLVATSIGIVWFHFLGISSRDIFYVFVTAMTGGILSALVQFYAIKSFLWKTLPTIVSETALQNPKEIHAPLTIRSKLLLSFLSVIFPALIFSNLMAYSAIFKKIRDEDIQQKLLVGQTLAGELSTHIPRFEDRTDFQRLFVKYRKNGLTTPLFVYDGTGHLIYGTTDSPLPREALLDVIRKGEDTRFNVGQEATALFFLGPNQGPVLLMWCPWFVYADALQNIRLMLAVTSFTLFVSLIVLTYLASHDISTPIRSLRETAKKIAHGKLDIGVRVFSDDEVGELAWSLREMTNRLRESNRSLERKVKERTQSLEDAYKELYRLNKMKDEFLSSVSHELRTPLTSIRSFSELLLNYPKEGEGTRTEFLSIINKESERLTRLVDDLLDLAKIESGRTTWNDERVDVEPLLHSVSQTFNVLTEGKRLMLLVDAQPGLPGLQVDRDRLVQVLTNLLSNAVKFTNPGGTIRLRAELIDGRRTDDKGKMIRFCVADTGVGIPEGQQEVIFDKFIQGGSAMEDKPKGTGLGLSICREIVQHYGGNIWAESTPNQGTNVYFTLRCDITSDDAASAPAPDPPSAAKRASVG